METFLAVPYQTTTTLSPLSPTTTLVVEDTVTQIIPVKPLATTYPKVLTPYGIATSISPAGAYYYDSSGIGENPLAQHETNVDMRYKFLDKWLYEDFPEILKMLKVTNDNTIVLSEKESKDNDISKDNEATLEKKSDFIGNEILTLSKNLKILRALVTKNNLKFYDLPYNESYVKKAQARYVKAKLEDMRK